jgi:hypothetical protein
MYLFCITIAFKLILESTTLNTSQNLELEGHDLCNVKLCALCDCAPCQCIVTLDSAQSALMFNESFCIRLLMED